MGGSENEWAGGAGEAAEAWEEARETLGAFGAWEVVAEGPAKEGPALGPWGVSSVAAELRLPLPVPLVGVTGSGGKAGGPLTTLDVEGTTFYCPHLLLQTSPSHCHLYGCHPRVTQQEHHTEI
jgi:hypothetical protein